MLFSATVTAKCVLENVEVVCPHEIFSVGNEERIANRIRMGVMVSLILIFNRFPSFNTQVGGLLKEKCMAAVFVTFLSAHRSVSVPPSTG